MKLLFIVLMLCSMCAMACTGDRWIDSMIERGALALTFSPSGELTSVKCDTSRYTKLQCVSAGEYVYDYYQGKKKG